MDGIPQLVHDLLEAGLAAKLPEELDRDAHRADRRGSPVP
jgi:hypothetical protein